MKEPTEVQYDRELALCRRVFADKMHDYGTSWRVMRIPSLIDQLLIKARRIRTIEEQGTQKIADSIASEFAGILNYCIITLIQLRLGATDGKQDVPPQAILALYDEFAQGARNLMLAKNHDYGEAWRQMRTATFTDMLLARLVRINQLLELGGKARASEGLESNLFDMINYSIFALIKLQEEKTK